jgi:tetratricopeptide (TPR) repeat protein
MLKCRIGLVFSAVLLPFALSSFAQNPIRPMVSAHDLAAPRAAAEEYKRGLQAFDKADWPAAIEHFRKAIAKYPNYPSAYNDLGTAYDKTGNPQEALNAFREAIGLDDHLSVGYLNLARVMEKQRLWTDAEGVLRRLLAVDARNGDAFLLLSYAQIGLGEFKDAATNAIEATALPGAHQAFAHYIAASAMQATNQDSRAVEQYTMFLQQSPDDSFAPQARAALHHLQGSP